MPLLTALASYRRIPATCARVRNPLNVGSHLGACVPPSGGFVLFERRGWFVPLGLSPSTNLYGLRCID